MNKQNCTTLKFADLFGLNIVAQTILKSNKYELGAILLIYIILGAKRYSHSLILTPLLDGPSCLSRIVFV